MTDDRHGDDADATPVEGAQPDDATVSDMDTSGGTDKAARVDDAAADGETATEPTSDAETTIEPVGDARTVTEPATLPAADDETAAEPAVEGETAADDETAAEPAADAEPPESSWRRLIGAARTRKLTTANVIIALLVGLLGFALIAQVHSNSSESTLANDRPDDLVRILSDLDARRDRLSTEIASLQDTVRQLNSGAQGRQAALDAAAKRADELGILGGTLPATGPGLVIDLMPAAKQQISADRVLDTIEELRGAGAEAMQINGTGSSAVRIIASTYFTDARGGVDVDGSIMGGTLTVTVVGDPQTMQAALSIAGGVVDSVRNDGGTVQVNTPGTVQVTALHAAQPLRFAKPVS